MWFGNVFGNVGFLTYVTANERGNSFSACLVGSFLGADNNNIHINNRARNTLKRAIIVSTLSLKNGFAKVSLVFLIYNKLKVQFVN